MTSVLSHNLMRLQGSLGKNAFAEFGCFALKVIKPHNARKIFNVMFICVIQRADSSNSSKEGIIIT
jgi:hypothetical protein